MKKLYKLPPYTRHRIDGLRAAWFPCPPWDIQLQLVWPVESAERLNRFCVGQFGRDPEVDMEFLGMCLSFKGPGGNIAVVALQEWDRSDNDCVDTLVHELQHANSYMLQDCGIKLKKATEEVYAYNLGYLTKHSLSLLA